MISVDIAGVAKDEDNRHVEIVFDNIGLDFIISQLMLLKSIKTEHIDLISDKWGGDGLDVSEKEGHTPVHHLKLILR